MPTIDTLQALVRQLMDPVTGCRWLKEQNFQSIAPYSIEEAYELVQAIEHQDAEGIRDELADQLYHLLIYCELARRAGWFDFPEVMQQMLDKQQQRRQLDDLTRLDSAEAAHADWRKRKREQQLQANPCSSVLDGIPASLPALARSQKIQDRAGHEGFDWSTALEVLEKLEEEIQELKHEIQQSHQANMQDELGDVLFTVVNLGRHLAIDAETALRFANQKFDKRFRYIEQQLLKTGQSMSQQSFAALLLLWQEAKTRT